MTLIHKLVPRLGILKKRLAGRVLARKLFRGIAIAVPAIGGIFAMIVTYYDSKRALKEWNAKNDKAAYSFGVAAVFDVVDAFAHLLVAFGSIHAFGLHHEHHWIHFAENTSLFSAVVATSSAILGEIFTPLPNEPSLPQITEPLQSEHQDYQLLHHPEKILHKETAPDVPHKHHN